MINARKTTSSFSNPLLSKTNAESFPQTLRPGVELPIVFLRILACSDPTQLHLIGHAVIDQLSNTSPFFHAS